MTYVKAEEVARYAARAMVPESFMVSSLDGRAMNDEIRKLKSALAYELFSESDVRCVMAT